MTDGDNTQMGRRAALRTGLAATSVAIGVSPVYAGSYHLTQQVKFPKYISDGEVVEKFKVHKKWDDNRRIAKDVLYSNRQKLHSIEGVRATSLTNSSETYEGTKGLKIKVYVHPEFDKSGKIPKQIDKIPIDIQVELVGDPGCGSSSNDCVNFETDDTLKGGEFVQGASTDNPGTSCVMVRDSSGNNRMLTCAHLFHDCNPGNDGCDSCPDINGRTAETYGGFQNIGDVESHSLEDDWAVIDKSGAGTQYSAEIEDHDAYPNCVGYVTEYSLEYWVSDGDFAVW